MVNTEGLKKNFTLHGRLMLLAEALLFITLMVFASRLFGMGDGLKITMAYLVAYLVPRTVVRRDIGWSWVSSAVLLVLAGILVYIDFRRLVHYTLFDGYSLEIPNITGDARSYYKWALHQYDGRLSASNMLFPGYGFLMVGLWKLFGVSVVWPQAMNLMFTLTSVAFTGKLTRRLLSHRVRVAPRYLLMAGLLLSCLLTFYLVVGTLLLKEASVFLGTIMAAYALSSFASPDKSHTPSCICVPVIRICASHVPLFYSYWRSYHDDTALEKRLALPVRHVGCCRSVIVVRKSVVTLHVQPSCRDCRRWMEYATLLCQR